VPTDGTEVEESLFGDVLDDEADFVHMSCEHHAGRAPFIEHGDRVAHHIGVDAVGKLTGVGTINFGCTLLVARRRRSVYNCLEKR